MWSFLSRYNFYIFILLKENARALLLPCSSASCERQPRLTSCNHFPPPPARLVLCRHLWGLPFPWMRGLRDGGVAALQAFNQDALTNRSRISLLDKASFILMLQIERRLVEKSGESKNVFKGMGEDRWHTVPVCALFDRV